MKPLLLRLIDKTDPTASLKHAAYAVGVVASTLWLTYDILRKPMTKEWVGALALYLAAVVVGKVVGSGPSPAPTAGAVPSTVIETGGAQ